MSTALVWFRRDLRLTDHRALFEACRHSSTVFGVFVFDDRILKSLPSDDRRLSFIVESLEEMNRGLEKRGSSLLILHGDPVIEIPNIARRLKCSELFFNKSAGTYGRERDRKVTAKLAQEGVGYQSFVDHVHFEPGCVLNGQGLPYKVFNPLQEKVVGTLGGTRLFDSPL